MNQGVTYLYQPYTIWVIGVVRRTPITLKIFLSHGILTDFPTLGKYKNYFQMTEQYYGSLFPQYTYCYQLNRKAKALQKEKHITTIWYRAAAIARALASHQTGTGLILRTSITSVELAYALPCPKKFFPGYTPRVLETNLSALFKSTTASMVGGVWLSPLSNNHEKDITSHKPVKSSSENACVTSS